MEQSANPIIQTLSKAKISRDLSYPIGAETISAAIESAQQFPQLKLQFYFWSDFRLRRGRYEFLRVEYRNNAPQSPTTFLYKRPAQYQWEIIVQPVPKIFRGKIKQYILDSGLALIKVWLEERTGLEQCGNDVLRFFYDEKLEQFQPEQCTHLEPQLQRSR